MEYFDNILQTHWYWQDLAQGIAKWHLSSVEALSSAKFWKKWNRPYLLNWVEYFDKRLRKHWYWQDLAQEIAKWHFSLVEVLPISKFWKSDNGAISWTEWNIVMKFCIHIHIEKMYPMRLWNDIWNLLSFCRDQNSEKNGSIAKWHFSSVEALPSAKFGKSENGLISWTEWNILIDFYINIDIYKT